MQPPRILVLDRTDVLADRLTAALATGAETAGAEVVACTQVAAVAELLEDEGPYDLLVAGPATATRTGLARVELIRSAYPLMSVILAFDQRPEARLRDVLRTGAIDLLELPAEDDVIVDCVARAVDLSRAFAAALPAAAPEVRYVTVDGAPAQAAADIAATAGPIGGGPGRVFTVASATGGCGKTFYATNLAYYLAQHSGLRVCIVDLDLQFGEVSTSLRLKPRYTIFDALEREDEDDENDLQDHIEEYICHHEAGMFVLPAPKDPIEAERVTPPDVVRVIEAVRRKFDYVVVDTPAQLADVVTVTLDLSEKLFVLTTLDLPSVRNMSVFLSTLERLRIPSEKIRLLLNKAESDVGIDIPQVEKLFPQGFMSILPYAKEVSRSINLGTPVLAASPQAEISVKMAVAMNILLPPEQRGAAQPPVVQKKRKLFRRG